MFSDVFDAMDFRRLKPLETDFHLRLIEPNQLVE
jgi:hypothetical protein